MAASLLSENESENKLKLWKKVLARMFIEIYYYSIETKTTEEIIMASKDIAKAYQALANAEACEALLTQAYALAKKSGISEELRHQFMALDDAMSIHRGEVQEKASASLTSETRPACDHAPHAEPTHWDCLACGGTHPMEENDCPYSNEDF